MNEIVRVVRQRYSTERRQERAARRDDVLKEREKERKELQAEFDARQQLAEQIKAAATAAWERFAQLEPPYSQALPLFSILTFKLRVVGAVWPLADGTVWLPKKGWLSAYLDHKGRVRYVSGVLLMALPLMNVDSKSLKRILDVINAAGVEELREQLDAAA